MIFNTLEIPHFLKHGIQPNARGASGRKFIYGGDSETCEGAPITFQFYSEQARVDDLLWIPDPADASAIFLKWCRSLRTGAQHVIYVHNLGFDLVSFLWDIKPELVVEPSGEFKFELDGWKITGVYGAPTFLRMSLHNGNKTVILVDSFSYYRASLAKAATVFCPHLPKLDRPEGLGKRKFGKRDEGFKAYAMRDAEVAYHIGLALENLHEEFDLAQTVSVADMAARVFRHHYLEQEIPQPPRPIIECALLSYHGGKNNLAVPPGWYPQVSSLDISSAYPDAMAGFPSFYDGTLYKKYRAKKPTRVPDLGVYRVWGAVTGDRWPSLFAHDFKPYRDSRSVGGISVAGYELNEALRSGEFRCAECIGWYYDSEKDRADPPLARYVAEFYARKEAEKDKGKRAMYKFMLNSISGKFIQTRKQNRVVHVDIDAATVSDTADLVAGGMFHPFIASLITAHTRARIHKLEHKYEALHTATDGIFTQADLSKMKPESGLGALVNEAQGDLLLLRNKLYVLYGEGEEGGASSIFAGKHIIKAALHGFAGSVTDLEKLVISGTRRYKAVRANRLRSSLKAGDTPNEFRSRLYDLKVGELPVHHEGEWASPTKPSSRRKVSHEKLPA